MGVCALSRYSVSRRPRNFSLWLLEPPPSQACFPLWGLHAIPERCRVSGSSASVFQGSRKPSALGEMRVLMLLASCPRPKSKCYN